MISLTKAELANMEEGACTECGRPERWRDFVGHCSECHNQYYYQGQEDRRAYLASLPRCEFCQRRGTHIAVGEVLLCGYHLRKANRKLQSFGIVGMAFDMSGEGVRSLLREKR